MKLSEVAEKLECRLEGAPNPEITGVAGIEHADARTNHFSRQPPLLPSA